MQIYGDFALCPHHAMSSTQDEWAMGNRSMCDLLHRQVVSSASSTGLPGWWPWPQDPTG